MPRRNRSLLTALTLVAATLVSLAAAQIDDRARTFLEGLNQRFDTDVTTLDQTSIVTTYMPDGSTVSATIRTVIDYVQRRAATVTEVMPGMEAIMIVKDGQMTMKVPGMPMALPAPPEAAESLEALFEPPAWPGFKDGDRATYDGQVAYGELLAGEQVSYTTKHVLDGEETDYTTRFVFGPDGAVLGYLVESPDVDPLLMVLDAPATGGYLAGLDASLYLPDGGGWKLSATMEFLEYKVNEPIDESLFE